MAAGPATSQISVLPPEALELEQNLSEMERYREAYWSARPNEVASVENGMRSVDCRESSDQGECVPLVLLVFWIVERCKGRTSLGFFSYVADAARPKGEKDYGPEDLPGI
jgi:hypothetical protein